MKDLRIIIAGSRDFNDLGMAQREINRIIKKIVVTKIPREEITIISGCARGADRIGEQYAILNKLKLKKMPANWDRYEKGAGYMRNREMAQYAAGIGETGNKPHGALIAFWDGKSTGTKHMIETAKNFKLDVHVVRYDEISINEKEEP